MYITLETDIRYIRKITSKHKNVNYHRCLPGKKGVKSHLTVHEEPSPTIKLLKNVTKKNKSCISEIFV